MGSIKLTELYEIAQEISTSQSLTDPMEVLLCYQIRLRKALNLPIETKFILYERISTLSEQGILTVKSAL
jgi:hypothetical protein